MRIRTPLLLAALATTVACNDDVSPTAVDGDRQAGDTTFVAAPRRAAGLVLEVKLTPARPRRGDTVTVTATVRNESSAPIRVESRICGLGLRGSLALRDPFVRCAGYSTSGMLAPRGARTESDRRIVTSAPGDYELDVMQLVNPEVWVRVPVRVMR